MGGETTGGSVVAEAGARGTELAVLADTSTVGTGAGGATVSSLAGVGTSALATGAARFFEGARLRFGLAWGVAESGATGGCGGSTGTVPASASTAAAATPVDGMLGGGDGEAAGAGGAERVGGSTGAAEGVAGPGGAPVGAIPGETTSGP
jgi:hypothetical protein